MRDLRALFNHACKAFNKKSLGIIKISHYPFDEYKMPDVQMTRKRNIDIHTLQQICKCSPRMGSRAELARDLFMLSFYLCGINAVDLYKIDNSNIIAGRLNYNRSKTRGKRRDDAFISIRIIREAAPLLTKYIGVLSLRCRDPDALNKERLATACAKFVK